jgi:SAM-dependent methyltransferase
MCGSSNAQVIATGRDYIYEGSRLYMTHVRCDSCSHVFLNPQPKPSSIGIMYPPNYGTFSKRFRGKTNLLGSVKTMVNMKRVKRICDGIPQGGRILDVGCGNGELLLALKRSRPDLELCGVDWHFPDDTRQALELAGIELIEAPLESADLPESAFDAILVLQLVEHLWEPQRSIQRLAATLVPGGNMIIETPNTDGYDRAFFKSGTWGGYYVPRHLNLYNFARLAKLVERAGLTVAAQRNLPAPVIWCYSFQGASNECFGRETWATKFFDPKNLPVLAAFALLDWIAVLLGRTTSNQQTIARR